MIQQINLYQDSLRQGQNKSGINLYWSGLAAIALLLISFSVYLLININNTENQVQQNITLLAAEQESVKLIVAKIPKQEFDPQLASEVGLWQTRLDELAQTQQLLSGNSPDQSPGFSKQFQALSNQSISDVWLRTIYLERQQQIINLEGSTFKPDRIPYFLQQLQKEPVFNGHSFAKLIVQKSENVAKQMDFTLNTTMEALDKKDHVQ